MLLLLSDDLIFNSRVIGTARECGASVKTARNADLLLNLARESPPACVIVDLANPGLNIAAVAAQLLQLQPPPRIVAYGSHVDTTGLQTARDAGCDIVLARSQFVAALPRDLPAWLIAKN